MAAKDVIKNFALFVDGRGYLGQIEDYSPPVLTVKTEDFRGAGMDAPEEIDLGMEKLEASFNLVAYDADLLALFGFVDGAALQLTVRAAMQSVDGEVKPIVHNMRGKIRMQDAGAWKPGEKPSLSVEMGLHYYRNTIAGTVVHEIDVRNMTRIIGGVDQLEAQRRAMGI